MKLFVAAVLTISSGAMAQHQDVIVTPVGGVLTTQARVYGADLGAIVPNFGDEPGFESDTLPAFAELGFDVMDAARVWDGSDFDALSASVITIELAPGVPGTPSVVTPAAPGVVAGYVIAAADEFGTLHQHLGMTLGAPASAGVYLLQLRLWEGSGAVGASEPLWIVLNNGADELEHDAAIAYVEEVLVPSPGLGLMAVAGLGAVVRRRRELLLK